MALRIRGVWAFVGFFWPLILWGILRFWADAAFQGATNYGAIVTLAAMPLWLPAIILFASRRSSPIIPVLCATAPILSGIIGLWWEWQRWQPFVQQHGFDIGLIASNLDYALVAASVACFLPLALFFLANLMPRRKPPPIHGSAQWMRMSEARSLLSDGDLVIGEANEPAKTPLNSGRAPLLKAKAEGHLLSVAGSRSGKTVSVVIPNCLTWPGSIVVHDPKNELAPLTAEARRKLFDREAILLDPNNPDSGSINLLEWIDPKSDKAVIDAQTFVSWFSGEREKEGSDGYFERTSLNLILVILIDILFDPDLPSSDKNLTTLRKRITSPNLGEDLMEIYKKGPEYAHGAAQQLAGDLGSVYMNAPPQWEGVRSGAANLTSWLSLPSLARLVSGTQGTTLPLANIASGKYDVFVCIPGEWMTGEGSSVPAAARLIFGSLLTAVYRQNQPRVARNQPVERVLFLLDEMGLLRYMPQLEVARDWASGMGVTLWGVLQGLGQLKRDYGEEGFDLWMQSSAIRTFFGVSSLETAEMLEKMLGKETVAVESRTRGDDGILGLNWTLGHRARTETYVGRPLMTADEIMRMAVDQNGVPDEQLVWMRGRSPLRCGLAKWYRRDEFKKLIHTNRV